MPRPSGIDGPKAARVIEAIRAGNYALTACGIAGLGKSTFYRWMERGAEEEEGPYRDFRDAVKKAETEAEGAMLERITMAAETTWQAAAWYLERKYPDRWGRRDRMEHTGKDGERIPFAAVRRITERADAEDGTTTTH